jgi:histidine triad (HIT) family protein
MGTEEQHPCKFCQIATGEVQTYKVYQNEKTIGFLDTRPLFPGHLLVIPRQHVETITDLPPQLIGPLFEAARFLAMAVEQAMEAEGTFIAVNNRVSQSVPHLHIHIVPRRRGDGLKGFFWPRQTYQNEAATKAVQITIAQVISRLKLAEKGRIAGS